MEAMEAMEAWSDVASSSRKRRRNLYAGAITLFTVSMYDMDVVTLHFARF
jgi:hypothetical protein